MEKPNLIVVTGPTGSGKSRLAHTLAKDFSGEIVNADSVQIYKDFNIGSAKPTVETMAEVPHHLFSFVCPTENFDVEMFRRAAVETIDSIHASGGMPIVVGGTGLYIRSLLCGLVSVPEPSDEAKDKLQLRMDELTRTTKSVSELRLALHAWLAEVDPKSAQKIGPYDLQRIQRALLVFLSLGVPLSQLQAEHDHGARPFRPLVISILPDRKSLYPILDNRVETMLSSGLVKEIEDLQLCYPLNCRPFSAIGYRHVCQFLEGNSSYEDMVNLLKRDTRRFAKRQLTWWRNQPKRLGWHVVDACSVDGGGCGESGSYKWDPIPKFLKNCVENFLGRKREFVADEIVYFPLSV